MKIMKVLLLIIYLIKQMVNKKNMFITKRKKKLKKMKIKIKLIINKVRIICIKMKERINQYILW